MIFLPLLSLFLFLAILHTATKECRSSCGQRCSNDTDCGDTCRVCESKYYSYSYLILSSEYKNIYSSVIICFFCLFSSHYLHTKDKDKRCTACNQDCKGDFDCGDTCPTCSKFLSILMDNIFSYTVSVLWTIVD
jgi:hypothetical protein